MRIPAWRWLSAAGIAALGAMVTLAPAMAATSYKLTATIMLPSGPKGGDIVNYDTAANRVYVDWKGKWSGGSGAIAVIDAATNKLVKLVGPVPGANGNAFDSKYIFAAAGSSNTIVVINKTTLAITQRVKTNVATTGGAKATTPDGIYYDPVYHRLWVVIDDNNTVQVYNVNDALSTPLGLDKIIDLAPSVPATCGPDLGGLAPQIHRFYETEGSNVASYSTRTLAPVATLATGVPMTKNGKTILRCGSKGAVYGDGHVWVAVTKTGPNDLIKATPDLKSFKLVPQASGGDQVDFDKSGNLVLSAEGGVHGFQVTSAATGRSVAVVHTVASSSHTSGFDYSNGDVYVLAKGTKTSPNDRIYVYSPVTVAAGSLPKTGSSPVTLPLGLALVGAGAALLLVRRRRHPA